MTTIRISTKAANGEFVQRAEIDTGNARAFVLQGHGNTPELRITVKRTISQRDIDVAQRDIFLTFCDLQSRGYTPERNAKDFPNGELLHAHQCYIHGSYSNALYEQNWKLPEADRIPNPTAINRHLQAGALALMESIRMRYIDSNLSEYVFDLAMMCARRIAYLRSHGATEDLDVTLPDTEDL